ncbi:MAG: HEAT repeat domain-containing protein [Planctomycetota bacterium]
MFRLLFFLGLYCALLISCASPEDKEEHSDSDRKIDLWIQMMGTERVSEAQILKYELALMMKGEQAYPKVVEGLKHLKPVVRGGCAYVLGQIGKKEAIPHLISLAEKDPNEEVKLQAAASLVDLQENLGLYYMILALEHDTPRARGQAHQILKDSVGLDFGYDPSGHPSDRDDSQKQWVLWWNKNKDTFQIPDKSETKSKGDLKEIPLK